MIQRSLDPIRGFLTGSVADDGVHGLVWALAEHDPNAGGTGEQAARAGGAEGWLDEDRTIPMPTDALFRIASVSKPILAVAALQAVEAGLTALDEPIDGVLPELADRQVLIDPVGDVTGPTEHAHRPITVRDLLTFQCGLGMDFDFERPQPVAQAMWDLGVGPGPTAPDCEPQEYLDRLATLPLAAQPGGRWLYHTGSDILSVYLERLRGQELGRILARDVFAPTGMTDTGFWALPQQRARLGVTRGMREGAVAVWDRADGLWSAPPSFRSGAAGLVSTAADLIAFGQMLLAEGQGRHGKVLSAESVQQMVTEQLTPAQRAAAQIETGHDYLGWGLGVGVYADAAPSGWPSAGCYGWDGGMGSRWLVDPARGLVAVLLLTDGFETPACLPTLTGFTERIGRWLAAR